LGTFFFFLQKRISGKGEVPFFYKAPRIPLWAKKGTSPLPDIRFCRKKKNVSDYHREATVKMLE
jgi:hypothetical protein